MTSFSRALWNNACNQLDWSTLENMLVTNYSGNEKKVRFHARNNKALFLACKHRKADICALLLKNDKVLDCYPEQRKHIFKVVFSCGHVDILKLLISAYRIKNLPTFEGLGLSIANGHVEMAQYIFNTLCQGANRTLIASNAFRNSDSFLQVVQDRQMLDFCFEKGLISAYIDHLRFEFSSLLPKVQQVRCFIKKWLCNVSTLQNLASWISAKTDNQSLTSDADEADLLSLKLKSLQNYIIALLIERDFGSLLYFSASYGATNIVVHKKTLEMVNWSLHHDKMQSLRWWKMFLPYGYIKVDTRRKEIALHKKTWKVQHRFGTSLAIGLAQLDLPVLLLLHLFYNMDTVCNCFDQNFVWAIMKTVKNANSSG